MISRTPRFLILESAHRSGTGKGVVMLSEVRNSKEVDVKGAVYTGRGDIGSGIL